MFLIITLTWPKLREKYTVPCRLAAEDMLAYVDRLDNLVEACASLMVSWEVRAITLELPCA